MKSSERRCHALTIFENVHGAKMEKGMYTNLYTEIWDSMIFRDMVNKCTMNTKPAKMAVCGFVILREILGLSSSPSAIALNLQALTNNVHEFVHETPGFNAFPGVFMRIFRRILCTTGQNVHNRGFDGFCGSLKNR